MRRGVIAIVLLAALAGALPASAAVESPSERREPVLVRADELQFDQELGLTVAKGHVELDQAEQILLADAVTYDQKTDTVTASGHVALLQPTGDVMFADYAELHDQMRDGFVKDIRLLLSDHSRLAGNTARRIGGIRTDIVRGVYSPCELCKDDPTRPPVWQIKAEEVVHDKDEQLVEYYDAVMEIDGIPVFYSPYFSHPDPSVKRASGFLPPNIGFGTLLGYHTTIPYYWAIAPDKDLTIRPELTTNAGALLGGEYRERFGNGLMINDASIATGGPRASASPYPYGPPTGTVRWDFFGNGLWDLNENWRAGYQIDRESDTTYMLLYNLLPPQNDLTTVRTTNNLPQHVFAEDFGANHYGYFFADAYQSLNPFIGNSIEPYVLPSASYEWWTDPDDIGGRWQFQTSALDLLHHTGPEVRRVSTQALWHLPFYGPIGDKLEFSASVRGDGYSADHVPLTPNLVTLPIAGSQPILLPSNMNTVSDWAGRAFPQAMLKWRYPLIRESGGGATLVEPEVAVIAGPNGENPPQIPNEDAQGFEFDEMSLFVPDRLPGYDRVDSGQRIDYGLHGELDGTAYGNWDGLVGQSYAFEHNNFFQPGSGLDTRISDIVGRVALHPNETFDLTYRYRLAESDLALRREEASLAVGPANLKLTLSLIDFRPVVGSTTIPAGFQVGGTVTAQLTRYWSTAVSDIQSFGAGTVAISSGASVSYHDDCIAVIGSIVRSGVTVANIRPGVSVLLTFVFKDLGEVGEKVLSE